MSKGFLITAKNAGRKGLASAFNFAPSQAQCLLAGAKRRDWGKGIIVASDHGLSPFVRPIPWNSLRLALVVAILPRKRCSCQLFRCC